MPDLVRFRDSITIDAQLPAQTSAKPGDTLVIGCPVKQTRTRHMWFKLRTKSKLQRLSEQMRSHSARTLSVSLMCLITVLPLSAALNRNIDLTVTHGLQNISQRDPRWAMLGMP